MVSNTIEYHLLWLQYNESDKETTRAPQIAFEKAKDQDQTITESHLLTGTDPGGIPGAITGLHHMTGVVEIYKLSLID